MKQALTNQEFWDKDYQDIGCIPMEIDYPITQKLYRYFSDGNGKTIFEIGCFPGRFLYHFGKMGFELNGVDQTVYLSRMIDWLKYHDLNIRDIFQGDFFTLSNDKKYDVVFSSGFIEHFINYDELIQQHIDFVKENGYLCITVPNFRGKIQKFLHSYFDKKNLEKHYLPSMNIDVWESIAQKNNMEIIESGFIGGFNFWVGPDASWIDKIFTKIIRMLFAWNFLPNHPSYSPEIFFIARKKGIQ